MRNENHCGDLKPQAPPCLQRRHKQLAPGVYTCSEKGHLHIVAPELCRANGYEATPENCQMLADVALEMFGRDLKVTD